MVWPLDPALVDDGLLELLLLLDEHAARAVIMATMHIPNTNFRVALAPFTYPPW